MDLEKIPSEQPGLPFSERQNEAGVAERFAACLEELRRCDQCRLRSGARRLVPGEGTPGAPLMLVERTAYARSGEPLEFARDLFRGDRTRVVVWTSDI